MTSSSFSIFKSTNRGFEWLSKSEKVIILKVIWVINLNGLPHSLLSFGHLIPGERAWGAPA